MNCYKCGTAMNDAVKFCPACGAPQSITRELVNRAKAGDQAAFTELYNRTADDTARMLKMYIKDEDAAQDLLQESYIKAFSHLDMLREPEKFKPWLKHIARNHAVDYLRRQKPVLFSQMENEDGEMPFEFEDVCAANLPDVMLDIAETRRLLDEILNTLPDDQRIVITMHHYSDIPVREIARELRISENTVKSRLSYGRKKIMIKVEELKKKGTKLYGLAPLPFLLLLFRSFNSHPAQVSPGVSANILSSCSAQRPLAQHSSAPQDPNYASRQSYPQQYRPAQQYHPAPQYTSYPARPVATAAAASAGKGIAGKVIAIILVIVIAAGAGITAIWFISQNAKEANYITNDYIEVSFTGSDGSGKAQAVFLTDKFEKDFIEKNGGDYDSHNIMDGKTLPIALKLLKLEPTISVSVSPNSGLKNGDTVTVTLSYNRSAADETDVRFSADSYTLTVSGLE